MHCCAAMTEEVVEEKGKIFVKNLPRGTLKDEVIQLFCTIGPLKEVILPKPKVHHTTVYGFISFQDERDTDKAISQYNNFVFCNSSGKKSSLSIVKAYHKVSKFQSGSSNLSSASSLWSVGSQESDKASSASDTHSASESVVTQDMKYPTPGDEWIKERKALMEIIAENDRRITDLEKKKGEQCGDLDLEKKERQLLEELDKLPKKISILKEEIEVLELQVKLKELEKERNQILNK